MPQRSFTARCYFATAQSFSHFPIQISPNASRLAVSSRQLNDGTRQLVTALHLSSLVPNYDYQTTALLNVINVELFTLDLSIIQLRA